MFSFPVSFVKREIPGIIMWFFQATKVMKLHVQLIIPRKEEKQGINLSCFKTLFPEQFLKTV